MMVEATSIDRQGSTTLPRVPPPVSNQPIETTAARHHVFSCGRLFRLGLAVQLVSRPGQSFHTRILVFSHFALPSHQRAEESVPAWFWIPLPCGKSGGPRLYSERTFRRRYSRLWGECRGHARTRGAGQELERASYRPRTAPRLSRADRDW